MLVWRKKKLWLVANGIRTKLELTAPAVSGFRLHNRTLADRLPSAHQQGCLLLLRLFQKIQNMELNITNIDARFEFLPSLSVYHPLITKVRLPISTNSTVFKKKTWSPTLQTSNPSWQLWEVEMDLHRQSAWRDFAPDDHPVDIKGMIWVLNQK